MCFPLTSSSLIKGLRIESMDIFECNCLFKLVLVHGRKKSLKIYSQVCLVSHWSTYSNYETHSTPLYRQWQLYVKERTLAAEMFTIGQIQRYNELRGDKVCSDKLHSDKLRSDKLHSGELCNDELGNVFLTFNPISPQVRKGR